MKKLELRHIIRKTIQEYFVKEVEDDDGEGVLDPSDGFSETNPYGGFGAPGGGGSMMGDFGIPFDQFLGDQLFIQLFGGSADQVVDNFIDAMNAPGDVEDNIGGVLGMDQEDAMEAASQYISQWVTDLQNYYNNQMPSGTEYPDGYNFSDNFGGNYNFPENVEYYLDALNNTTAPQLQAAVQDTLESYCNNSSWYLETIANTDSLAGAAIQAHIQQHANTEGGPFSVPFSWCPEQYLDCFPNCNETPWVQYSMSKEEYCETRFGGELPQFPETSCFNDLYYNCMGIALPTPIQPTTTSGHGCMDPAAFNYNPNATSSCVCAGDADVGMFNAQPACPCNYDETLQLQTTDGDTVIPRPEPPKKDTIKKDTSIGVTPPRPQNIDISKLKRLLKIKNNNTKARLQELANLRKRK